MALPAASNIVPLAGIACRYRFQGALAQVQAELFSSFSFAIACIHRNVVWSLGRLDQSHEPRQDQELVVNLKGLVLRLIVRNLFP